MLHDSLAILSGSLVGFVLGLIGGGGSILAVPLLVYVVGVASPHVAIGTGAVAVCVSALISLAGHARAGNVKWPCSIAYSVVGIVGAAFGSMLGKNFDGQRLLTLFGLLMIVVATTMAMTRSQSGNHFVPLNAKSAASLLPRLAGYGLATGALSGFFGIGGGFLIVPGLIAATDMPLLSAVGSSLVSVSAFGFATAVSYAMSGLIDWRLVILFVVGSFAGSLLGTNAAATLGHHKQRLSQVFAGLVGITGFYITVRGILS